MKHNGWRKPTPGLVEAEKHAQVGEQLAVPKKQAIVAVKKVAAALGLKPADMLLIDTLSSVTQDQDWKEGRRPIVWPSNDFLMAQCGFSLPALKRHLRRLAEVGVISFMDSPNGKRWGRRDDEGNIVVAYGIDLAPLAARTAEFEARHAEILEERVLCKSLLNTITISRRIIRAKIEKALENRLRGPWRELQVEFSGLLDMLPRRSEGADRLLNLVDWFTAFKEKVEVAFSRAFDWPDKSDATASSKREETDGNNFSFSQKMNPRGFDNEPHIQTTNQPNPVKSNSFENKASAESVPEPQPSGVNEYPERHDLDSVQWSEHPKQSSEVELPTVMAAFPEFADVARGLTGGYVRNWDDLHRSAGLVRGMCGISEDAWNVAQTKLGPHVAAAAIALIYEKYSNQEIQSPGGYLRGMVDKALNGELHLERSIYGRLNGAGGLN